jgi:hypothetical protein
MNSRSTGAALGKEKEARVAFLFVGSRLTSWTANRYPAFRNSEIWTRKSHNQCPKKAAQTSCRAVEAEYKM